MRWFNRGKGNQNVATIKKEVETCLRLIQTKEIQSINFILLSRILYLFYNSILSGLGEPLKRGSRPTTTFGTNNHKTLDDLCANIFIKALNIRIEEENIFLKINRIGEIADKLFNLKTISQEDSDYIVSIFEHMQVYINRKYHIITP